MRLIEYYFQLSSSPTRQVVTVDLFHYLPCKRVGSRIRLKVIQIRLKVNSDHELLISHNQKESRKSKCHPLFELISTTIKFSTS